MTQYWDGFVKAYQSDSGDPRRPAEAVRLVIEAPTHEAEQAAAPVATSTIVAEKSIEDQLRELISNPPNNNARKEYIQQLLRLIKKAESENDPALRGTIDEANRIRKRHQNIQTVMDS